MLDPAQVADILSVLLPALSKIITNAKEHDHRVMESVVQETLKDATPDEVNQARDYLLDNGVTIVPDDTEIEFIDETPDDGDKVQPYDPSKIDIVQETQTLTNLVDRLQYDEIELMPDFQRKAGLWDAGKQSRLIESIMLRIPIPAFYFDGTMWDRWVIIDGLQRLTALKAFFVDKTLKLTGLEYLTQFNGMGFDDLPGSRIRRMRETQMFCYIIRPGAPDNLKYNIFKRVNTGGLELEPQEIRHALFQGFATQYLKELAQLPSFLNATCESIPTDRMMDREFVLRFLSFYELDIGSYTGVIDDFLVSGMKHINKVYGANPAHAEEVKNLFDSVLKTSSTIFGKFAFRRIPNRKRRRPINKALFTIWTVLLAKCTPEERTSLEERRELLMELYIPMFTKEAELYKYLGSGKPSSVRKQFQQIESLIRRVLSCRLLPYPIERIFRWKMKNEFIAVICYTNGQVTTHFPDGSREIFDCFNDFILSIYPERGDSEEEYN